MSGDTRSVRRQALQSTPLRFADEHVRAETLTGTVCRAIGAALRDSKLPRSEIARLMSEFSGQNVTKNMLDAYASQAREGHVISIVRFIALLHATQDRRLLELIAEQFGWSVIERHLLTLIELAQVQARLDDLLRDATALRRQTEAGVRDRGGNISSFRDRSVGQ